MNNEKWPVLLTGTIKPNPQAISKFNDPLVRKKQYIETLTWMAKARTDIDKVIFCENSYSSLIDFEHLYSLFEKNNRSIEMYSVPMPEIKLFFGKGWGEGLMILWAVENVLNTNRANGFIKITGRYRILNLKRVVTIIRRGLSKNPHLKFIGHSFTIQQRLHIRSDFFWCDREFYLKYLSDVYKDVNDDQGNYLEHALAKRLWQLSKQHDIAILTIPLLIQGISGWNAKEIMGTRHYIKEEIKQALSPLPPLKKLADSSSI
ncbi:MAG: hypothetical protein Q7I89_02655 [Syntrophales bacterium]|nr:hypothetical protein [Syntrophales bacterium]